MIDTLRSKNQITMSSKNQITIPKEAREHTHTGPGGKFRLYLHPNGGIMLLPVVPITKLKGSLPKLDHPLSIEEMNAAIEEGATMRWRGFEAQTKEERKLRKKTAETPAVATA